MIPLCTPEINGNEWKYIKECLDTGWVSSAGGFVDRFQEKFGEYVGARKAVATVSGTSALHLALKSLGIKEGDEVIVPSMTFVAPVNAIRYVGAVPVFADVCRDTYVMDAQRVEELITDRTRAILPVHTYGHPADMDIIMALSRKYELFVVEDATEALGALYKGKSAGTIGHAGCYSFNGNKLITTGGGGMLVTNNESAGEYAEYLSVQAKTFAGDGGFYHNDIGFNYRMPNINAAMGIAQLENIHRLIEAKKRNARMYGELLNDVEGIALHCQKEWAENAYWLYSVLIEDSYKGGREALIRKLRLNDIETRPFFTPVHLMTPYRTCRSGDMGVTEDISQRGLNLPSSVGLKENELQKICELIRC